MNKILPVFIILLLSVFLTNAQNQNSFQNVYNFIENPAVFEINQVPGHTPMVRFNSIPEALLNDWENSPGYLSLNGEWRFDYVNTPEESPNDFFLPGFNDKSWDKIKVPSNWQMQGFGHLKFRNIAHPFRSDPPMIPREYNPVGSYRKSFNIPEDWNNQQIYLRFEGISSASMVWVNGREVGYNQGAFEPSEYDITDFISPGENLVAVKVFQWSDGIYLEDQDFWRLSGIFRDAYIYSMPQVHIRDYYVMTDLDGNYTDADLKIEADIKNHLNTSARGYRIRATLYDRHKKQVVQFQSSAINLPSNSESKVKLNTGIKNPAKWSAEKPNLYHLTLELIQGKEITTILLGRIGFRKVEVRGQALLVNGVAVKLNGVNSHMQHPQTGRAMDTETIRKDMTIMKQFNINCVRTSHYPPNIEYLQLADEFGIFMIDETGCEAHATEYLSGLKEWQPMYLDRVRKMVLRDRNHPSIIIWSAGNESGWGENICAMIAEGKRLDPSRPAWMYGGNRDENPATNPIQCEDIVGPRYGTPFELKTLFAQVPESEDPRPSFMDEYLSAAGNALGGLDEYWEVIHAYPRIIGGAIWDYVSPGLPDKVRLLEDKSPLNINVSIMGRAKVENGYIDLSGHDEWVEVYRHPGLDIIGDRLTLSMKVFPRKWLGTGTFLTKGYNQYGIQQITKDTLEFYLTTRQKFSVKAPLPANWENNWHHLTGIYDGSVIKLFVNGKSVAEIPCSGKISDFPFPVNIGRNPEKDGQDHAGYLVNARISEVRVFDSVIPPDQILENSTDLIQKSLLWLDFENEKSGGEFFSLGIGARSYGTIWPDRTIQPEMWQLKKSAQPMKASWLNAEKGIVEISNRFHFTNLNEFDGFWKVWEDGRLLQEGPLTADVAPLVTKNITIPFKKPDIEEGKEYRLEIGFRLRENTIWAEKGHEIAWDQLELPWHKKLILPIASIHTAPALIPEGEDLLVKGENFEYRFSKEKGGIQSMKIKSKEYLGSGPVASVWRASMANEIDGWTKRGANLQYKPGMGNGSANAWNAAGFDKLAWQTDHMSQSVTPDQRVRIEYHVHALGTNFGSGFDNLFIYLIDSNGHIELEHTLTPWGTLPAWIPKAGIQFILPETFNQISWYGRGPYENYPDRKTGAKINIYKTTVEEEYQPYLIPQDHGLKTDTRWVRFEDGEGAGIEFSGDQLFNYSAQQFETDNLTRALYPFQLLPFDGIIFNYDYETSGVGCTAISVHNKYRVQPKVFKAVVSIRPF